jgi:branched-chain amino acid transport system permease protein
LLAVVLFVLAVGAITGVGLERLAFKPFRRLRDEASLRARAMREATLLSSLAVSIVTREVMTRIFGSQMQTIPQAYLLQHSIHIDALSISNGDMIIFASSAVMLGALQFLLFRTSIGLSIRAVANSPLGAQFVGINTDKAIIARPRAPPIAKRRSAIRPTRSRASISPIF